MNILLELKNKMVQLIDSINVGESELEKCDALKLIFEMDCCIGNKKLYRMDIAERFNIEICEIDKLIEVGKLMKPQQDKDGIDYWLVKQMKDVQI